ncbi:PEP-CTERM sorting domain-containing protein [Thiobacillus sp.]
MPRKSSASRARTRRIGLLGLLLTTLLTPAGIVGTVTAAALIGGLAFHLDRAAPVASSIPPKLISAKTGSPQHLTIERDGETVSLVMTEEEFANDGGEGRFDPAGPLFAGLTGDGPARRGAPGGLAPGTSPDTSTPGGGSMPGDTHSPTGPASHPPSLAGPTGTPPSGGSSPRGSSPAGAPPGPSTPPHAGGPHTPTGKGAPADPPGETGAAPAYPDETTQPPHGMPEDSLPVSNPGTPLPSLAGEPFDPLTPPPGKKPAAQPNAVPEPSMLGLILLGVAAMAWAGRRRPDSLRLA